MARRLRKIVTFCMHLKCSLSISNWHPVPMSVQCQATGFWYQRQYNVKQVISVKVCFDVDNEVVSVFRSMGTPLCLSTMFAKGDNCCYFLLASLDDKYHSEKSFILKGQNLILEKPGKPVYRYCGSSLICLTWKPINGS